MKRLLPFIALAALALLFIAGAAQLYSLRLKRGDIYPALSSLRADPLGAKVLHDALAHLAGSNGITAVEQNYAPLDELRATPPATLFYLGVSTSENIKPALQAAREGHRVILTFQPVIPRERPLSPEEKAAKKKREAKRKHKKEKNETPKADAYSVSEDLTALGLKLRKERAWFENGVSSAVAAQPGLEPELKWVGTTALEITPERAANFTTLYQRDSHPVIVERPVGKGSIVIATDSYFLSNEALYKERPPLLIAHLLGNSPRIVFDEVHHDVEEQRGISWLIREYRLFGTVFALFLLALLYLWKEGFPLLPPRGDAEEEEEEYNAVGNEGFVLLLRRSIAPSRLLGICVDEWNKTFSHQHAPLSPPAKGVDPAAEYTRISKTLPKKMR